MLDHFFLLSSFLFSGGTGSLPASPRLSVTVKGEKQIEKIMIKFKKGGPPSFIVHASHMGHIKSHGKSSALLRYIRVIRLVGINIVRQDEKEEHRWRKERNKVQKSQRPSVS